MKKDSVICKDLGLKALKSAKNCKINEEIGVFPTFLLKKTLYSGKLLDLLTWLTEKTAKVK